MPARGAGGVQAVEEERPGGGGGPVQDTAHRGQRTAVEGRQGAGLRESREREPKERRKAGERIGQWRLMSLSIGGHSQISPSFQPPLVWGRRKGEMCLYCWTRIQRRMVGWLLSWLSWLNLYFLG